MERESKLKGKKDRRREGEIWNEGNVKNKGKKSRLKEEEKSQKGT